MNILAQCLSSSSYVEICPSSIKMQVYTNVTCLEKTVVLKDSMVADMISETLTVAKCWKNYVNHYKNKKEKWKKKNGKV